MSDQIQTIRIYEKVLIDGAIVDVMRGVGDQRVLTVTIASGRQYVIPMGAVVARDVGMKLAAPGIVAPDNGGKPV